jgi:hypothetical protein
LEAAFSKLILKKLLTRFIFYIDKGRLFSYSCQLKVISIVIPFDLQIGSDEGVLYLSRMIMRLSPTQNEVESNPTNFRKENRMKLL